MTKPCNACREQIDEQASKCPKCRAYQNWYRNPGLWRLLWLLPLALLLWSPFRQTRTAPRFADYKDQFSTSVVEESASATGRTQLVTVRFENKTDATWKQPTVQIESLDENDKVLCVEHLSAYNVTIGPKSSALATLTLRIMPAQPVAKRRVTLTDIDYERF